MGKADEERNFRMSAHGGRSANTDNETGRIETFSDGVFAIAITLLVLEIRVPHVEEGTSLLGELIKLWPSYIG
jgi:TMEM175 potassium channel family protein